MTSRDTGPYLSLQDQEELREFARRSLEKRTKGLYEKYIVLRTDGKPVEWCFVLEPHDPLAQECLALYAKLARADGRIQLARDIEARMARPEEKEQNERD